jgi:hypothetical protein
MNALCEKGKGCEITKDFSKCNWIGNKLALYLQKTLYLMKFVGGFE